MTQFGQRGQAVLALRMTQSSVPRCETSGPSVHAPHLGAAARCSIQQINMSAPALWAATAVVHAIQERANVDITMC